MSKPPCFFLEPINTDSKVLKKSYPEQNFRVLQRTNSFLLPTKRKATGKGRKKEKEKNSTHCSLLLRIPLHLPAVLLRKTLPQLPKQTTGLRISENWFFSLRVSCFTVVRWGWVTDIQKSWNVSCNSSCFSVIIHFDSQSSPLKSNLSENSTGQNTPKYSRDHASIWCLKHLK